MKMTKANRTNQSTSLRLKHLLKPDLAFLSLSLREFVWITLRCRLWLLLYWFKARGKVTQELRLFHDAIATDRITLPIDCKNCFDDVIDVTLRVNAMRNREPDKFHTRG